MKGRPCVDAHGVFKQTENEKEMAMSLYPLQRFLVVFTMLLMLPSLMLVACSSGGGDSDDDDIQKELENKLTSALEFDGGEVVEGAPPEGESGDGAPQVESLEAPAELRLGQGFTVSIESDYATPEDVDKAIVYIEGADNHIRVPGHLLEDMQSFIMELAGNLKDDPDLKGKTFTVKYALQTSDGHTGLYREMTLKVMDVEAQVTANSLEILDMGGSDGNGVETLTSRPEGHSGEDFPQITNIIGKQKFEIGGEVSVQIFTDYTDYENVRYLLITAPGTDTTLKYELDGMQSGDDGIFAVMISKLKANASPGDIFALMFALMTDDEKTGLYRVWKMEIVEGETPPDGDTDGDVDGDVDGDTDGDVDGDTDGDVDGDEDEVIPDSLLETLEGIAIMDYPEVTVELIDAQPPEAGEEGSDTPYINYAGVSVLYGEESERGGDRSPMAGAVAAGQTFAVSLDYTYHPALQTVPAIDHVFIWLADDTSKYLKVTGFTESSPGYFAYFTMLMTEAARHLTGEYLMEFSVAPSDDAGGYLTDRVSNPMTVPFIVLPEGANPQSILDDLYAYNGYQSMVYTAPPDSAPADDGVSVPLVNSVEIVPASETRADVALGENFYLFFNYSYSDAPDGINTVLIGIDGLVKHLSISGLTSQESGYLEVQIQVPFYADHWQGTSHELMVALAVSDQNGDTDAGTVSNWNTVALNIQQEPENLADVLGSHPDATGQSMSYEAGIPYLWGQTPPTRDWGIMLTYVGSVFAYSGNGNRGDRDVHEVVLGTPFEMWLDYSLPADSTINGADITTTFMYVDGADHHYVIDGNFGHYPATGAGASGSINLLFDFNTSDTAWLGSHSIWFAITSGTPSTYDFSNHSAFLELQLDIVEEATP